MYSMQPVSQLAVELASGRTNSATLVEECLSRIADPTGEGARVFLKVHADAARATAKAIDQVRGLGVAPSRYAGVPVSVKDLFDIAGEVTTAGSRVLADAPPATADSTVVARLRAAGLIVIGRTNMTEFAYSGLGLNPHYSTPRNGFERAKGRIPGGSSSGAAISVTDGMAAVGIGTDTGGSCRIPAALTGTVGYKPTASRIPREGVLPLSKSLDSIGVIAPTVTCCASIDAILADEMSPTLKAFPIAGLRLAIPQSLVLENLDAAVAAAFARTVSTLSMAKARICDVPLKELLELPTINAMGGFPAAEAYAWHRHLLEIKGNDYDPRVRARIKRGELQSAADYIDLCTARRDFIRRVEAICTPFDALILPTVPIVAPAISELENDQDYDRVNLLMLRNPSIVNFLDGCAISLPCHDPGEAPVGLMIVGVCGADQRLMAIARTIEELLSVA